MNADMERAALDHLGSVPASALVAGFGPGVGLVELARRGTRRAVGIDPSAAMVAVAGRRPAAEAPELDVELRACPVEQLAPGLGPFDAAVAVNCQQVFEPADAALAAIAGVLRPGSPVRLADARLGHRAPRPLGAWRAQVELDAAGAGLTAICWGHGSFRSGAGTLLRAIRGRATPDRAGPGRARRGRDRNFPF